MIDDFDKDQLAEFAQKEFGLELDMRKGIDKLKAEVKKLQVKPVVKEEAKPAQATHILNRDTGRWFPWTDLLRKHLTNAIGCDKDGNPV